MKPEEKPIPTWQLIAGLLLAGILVTSCVEASESPPYLIDKEQVPGGWMCYYSDGSVYGPVRSCPRVLW